MSNIKTYQQMRRDFQELFFNKLAPALQQYEKERKIRLFLAVIFGGIFLCAGLFLTFMSIYSPAENGIKIDFEILKSALILYIIAWGIWFGIKKSFENKIKKKIMADVCTCLGGIKWLDADYPPDGSEIYLDSNLIPKPVYTYSFDDIFTGKYKDVGYEIAEAEFEQKAGRFSITVFDGVIIKLQMNKKFKGNTIIQPTSLIPLSKYTGLVHTELEDPVFEAKFDVFTTDEVEARYLITPSFMERLKDLKTAFSAKTTSCAFWNKYLLVGLHTKKDLFSLGSLTKPVNDEKQFFQMFEEILSIIKLIDHFKLDQKIGQ